MLYIEKDSQGDIIMKEFDIEKIDCYMRRAKIDPENLKWYDPKDGIVEVLGLYWFNEEKRYNRFPESMESKTREQLVQLATCTAGGQIRFRTDSKRVIISATNTSAQSYATMAEAGRRGFDLYTGDPGQEVFWNTALPVSGELTYAANLFEVQEQKMRSFTINLPLYCGVEEILIGIDDETELLPPLPLPVTSPVVIYGTSITQGGCASRPGTAFTNRLSRKLQCEFLNFGFSGQGKNDLEIAELLSTIKDPALFIIDSEANSVSVEHTIKSVPQFIDILRSKHPQVPILIVTKVTYGPRYGVEIPSLKKAFHKIYLDRVAAGDKNIFFVDGSTFWEKDYWENTIDGAHPTDAGFMFMAEKLEPVLRDLLTQYGHIK